MATGSPSREPGRPYLGPAAAESLEGLSVVREAVRPTHRTLGDVEVGARVVGPARFPTTLLMIPFEPASTVGVDVSSIRVFRQGNEVDGLIPVWNSGVNPGLGHAWARITRPGEYFPIGPP